MKKLFDQLQDAITMQHPCNEKKCATCFENRGCIHELYPDAIINKIEKTESIDDLANISHRTSKRA